MNRWTFAFAVSVILHLVILFLCSGKWKDFEERRLLKLVLTEDSDPSAVTPESGPASSGRPDRESEAHAPPVENRMQLLDTVIAHRPFSLRHLLSPSRSWDEEADREKKDDSQEEHENALRSRIRSWSTQPDDAAGGTDIAGDYIRNKTVPGMIQASRNPAPGRKEKETAPRFDFIPTLSQVQALCLLGEQDGATGPELYSQTGTGACTLETWEREMEILLEKGFVRRKLVSPRNELTLFGFPVELSSKNRRNRIYRYEPAVTRGDILTYLNSRRFLLLDRIHRAARDSTALAGELARLEEKILMLMESLSNPILPPVPRDSAGNPGQG
ncbi:hypothetical protein JW906_10965 [bacterium]|nr:hypothetical protein [bacterium]